MPRRPKKFPRCVHAPKRSATAYFLFMGEKRQATKEEHPGLKMSQLTKKIAEKWKSLTEAEKEPYATNAAELRVDYQEKMTEYRESGKEAAYKQRKKEWQEEQGIDGGNTKKGKFPKDPDCPKRPKTGYFLFMADRRAAVQAAAPKGSRVGDIAKILGKEWKALDTDKKAKYNASAQKLKDAHKSVMETYKESDGYKDWLERKQAWQARSKAASKPTPRAAAKAKKQVRRRPKYVDSDYSDDANVESDGNMSDLHSDEPPSKASSPEPEPEQEREDTPEDAADSAKMNEEMDDSQEEEVSEGSEYEDDSGD